MLPTSHPTCFLLTYHRRLFRGIPWGVQGIPIWTLKRSGFYRIEILKFIEVRDGKLMSLTPVCFSINKMHNPTLTLTFLTLTFETCKDSSHQNTLLIFMLALSVRPSVSLIPSLLGSLYVARSHEQWPEALKTTGQKYWHPLFTLRLTPDNRFLNKLKRRGKQHWKFQQKCDFITKISLYLSCLVGFIGWRGREFCKQIC